MSNNYTQFSTCLKLNSLEEKAWWNKLAVFDVRSAFDSDLTDEDLFREMVYQVCDEDYGELQFQLYVYDHGVYFYADEQGDAYEVAKFVHYFLKEFRPDSEEEFHLAWAETCDMSECDEFTGGVVIATTKGVGICNLESQICCAREDIHKI